MEFWKFLRSDTIKALEDPLVKKILPRYVKVVEDELPANFQIAKRIVFDFDKSLSEKQLWKEHSKLMEKFYEIQEIIDKGKLKIKDLEIPHYSLLDLKIMLTKEILKNCELCERKCHVNRLEGEKGFCRVEGICLISSEFIHMGEESHISPSHTIFFMGCTFQCQYCFEPESFVITENGITTLNKLFKEWSSHQTQFSNQKVITHTGEAQKILKTFCHHYDGDLIVIKPLYLPEIKCTPSHSIFVLSKEGKLEKIKAKDLTKKNLLVIPKKFNFGNIKTINTKSILSSLEIPEYRKSVSRINKQKINEIIRMKKLGYTSKRIGKKLNIHPTYVRKIISKIRKIGKSSLFFGKYELKEENEFVRFTKEKGKGIPKRIKIDTDLGAILGYYCAEGCVTRAPKRPNSYKLIFSYGKHETELVNHTCNLIKKIFKCDPTIKKRKTTITVELEKTSIALFFKIFCGENSKVKRIPKILLKAKKDVIQAFLEAYIKGDGWVGKTLTSVNTVSKELALGVCLLLIKIGKLPRFYIWKPKPKKIIEKRCVKQSPLFYVKFLNTTHKNNKVLENGSFYFIPISSISREKYSGPVFNLEVTGQHSYLANFFAVGNCQNWTISQWFEKGYPLTPMEIARLMEKRRKEGSRNVNFVGGEPTPNLLYILEALKGCDANVPTVWNSNFFMSEKTMQILDGIIDLHLSDFKYGNDKCALTLSKVSNYFEVCSRNHLLATKQAEVTVRHLILPNHVECCSKPILSWISKNIKEKCIVNLMDQYRPEFKAEQYTDINRRITQEEFEEVVDYAKKLNINYTT